MTSNVKKEKNMKKLLLVLLALCVMSMTLVLASCDSDEPETPVDENVENVDTPETPDETPTEPDAPAETPAETPAEPEKPAEVNVADLVNGAVKATLEAGGYEAKIYKNIDSDIMGTKKNSWLDVVAKANGNNISVEGKKFEYDYESAHNYYYDGSWMYYTMYESNFKQQATLEEFANEAGGIAAMLVELPEAAFANATKADNGGETAVELTLDEATVKTAYRGTVVKIFNDILGDMIDPVVISNAKLNVTVANGYIKAFSLTFTGEYTAGKDKVTYNFNQTIDFANVGQGVTINLPANLSDYMEMDWG